MTCLPPARRRVPLGVVLLRSMFLLVVVDVHLLRVLLGVLVGADLVDLVQALGLDQLVDLGADEAGQDLLGQGVLDGFACRSHVSVHS